MEKFNGTNVKILREDINEALAIVAEKHGLKKLKVSPNINYKQFAFSLKVEVEAAPSDESISQEARLNAEKCRVLGLPENAVGQEFVVGRHTYILDHIDLKKHTYPIIGKELGTDKMYKFKPHQVKLKITEHI